MYVDTLTQFLGIDTFSLCQIVFLFLKKSFVFFPNTNKCVPFRVDPFSEGNGVQESKQQVTNVVSLVKMAENVQMYLVPKSDTYIVI